MIQGFAYVLRQRLAKICKGLSGVRNFSRAKLHSKVKTQINDFAFTAR